MSRAVAIIGGGPAGLMAAEAAAERGATVDVFDSKPSVGHKFLMAGKSGLNLTHAEPFADFTPDAILWPVAVAAADLLTTRDHPLLRECASDECSWLYLDTTRNHSRRWCDMKGCGNKAKVRRYRQRQAS